MAVKLIATYSKRLGLPGYSSHQFSVCVETEIINPDDIRGESAQLYETLQRSVDEQIQQNGFVPVDGQGQNGTNGSSNGHHNGNGSSKVNGQRSGRVNGENGSSFHGRWLCSDRQQDLILKLVDDHQIDKHEVEAYASEQFGGKGVKYLDTKEASALIEYLLTLSPPKANRGRQPVGGHRS